jgi:hypothetical protein
VIRLKGDTVTDRQEKQESQVQTGMRVPESWLDRLDRLAKKRSEPGITITRTEMLRLATYRGIVELEAEDKKR